MNMNKALSISLLLCLLCFSAVSQFITVSGFVFDKHTGEALIGATVYAPALQQGTVCNEFGFYSLTVADADSLLLQASFTGYKPQYYIVKQGVGVSNNFRLEQGIELQSVEVTAEKNIVKRNEISMVELPVRDIQSLPNLFGEVDIIKAFQLTAGVQSGGEGNNNLYVRGGSPDQNLVLLDDVPLYYVSHFGGFFRFSMPTP